MPRSSDEIRAGARVSEDIDQSETIKRKSVSRTRLSVLNPLALARFVALALSLRRIDNLNLIRSVFVFI